MSWDHWLEDYESRYRRAIFGSRVKDKLIAFYQIALDVRARNGKLIFLGNGASASISSHGAVDFTKQAHIRAIDFNEPNLITAFSNDYGFENYMARALRVYGDEGDCLVAISVSGKSPNVIAAAQFAKSLGYPVVSFTGSASDNPLRALSEIDFWVDSRAYNIVECTTMIWLTTVIDMIVGKPEYNVS